MDPALLYRLLLYARPDTRKRTIDDLIGGSNRELWVMLASTVRSNGDWRLRARCLEALGLAAGGSDEAAASQILALLVPTPSVPSPKSLSRRESEIAGLVARGLSNRTIANQLGITQGTVNVHVEHILDKLSVPNRAAIGAWVGQHADQLSAALRGDREQY